MPDAGGIAPPFIIEEYDAGRANLGEAHRHVPGARLVLDAGDAGGLRASGLLVALGESGAHSLLVLVSFLSANGAIRPSVTEVAGAMGTSERQARERLLHLQRTVWNGLPLLREVAKGAVAEEGAGQDYYVLSPRLVGRRAVPPSPPQEVLPASQREAVLSWSRSQYATPREEAERLVGLQLGKATTTGTTPSLFDRLVGAGVAPAYAERLIATEPEDEIEKQLAWLPARGAKEPGKFLVAAVRGRYAEPRAGSDR